MPVQYTLRLPHYLEQKVAESIAATVERDMLSAIVSKISETTSVESEFDTPTVGPLMIEASGDPAFPFYVCPVDGDGIQLSPVAAFENHADALRFATMNHPRSETHCPDKVSP